MYPNAQAILAQAPPPGVDWGRTGKRTSERYNQQGGGGAFTE